MRVPEEAVQASWGLAAATNISFLFVNYFQDDTNGMIFSGFLAVICMPLASKKRDARG